jgi:hypothetical protein
MNSSRSRSYDLLWLSLALLFLQPIALFLSITPHDYWFYVRIGRDILESGAIPRMDTFSFTYPGRPIFYQPWLSAVIFWQAHSLGGATLTFLLKGISVALAYGILWTLMRRMGTSPWLATILLILLGLSSSTNWSMRPQILAYPLFAMALWILWHWQYGRVKGMWILPIVVLWWANIHGSFILAFVLMGSALLFGAGDRKKLAVWLAVCLLGTLINPRGIFVWQFVSDMLTSPSDQLFATEWRPPVNAGWQMNIFFGWLLLFIPLAAFSPRRLSRLEWVWFLGFGWLALTGLRYVIWFMFIMAVMSGILLIELLKSFHPGNTPHATTNPAFNYILSGLILLLPFMMLPGLRESWWAEAPPPYHEATTPAAAAEWLAANPDLAGPLFADYTFGSYLTYALPSRLLWIDNRFNAYPPEHWDRYQTISSARYPWERLLEEDNVNLLLLSLSSQKSLVEAVEESGGWCKEYRDQTAVIFSRCEPIP